MPLHINLYHSSLSIIHRAHWIRDVATELVLPIQCLPILNIIIIPPPPSPPRSGERKKILFSAIIVYCHNDVSQRFPGNTEKEIG